MKITFFGAARQVTGSKHLIELKNGKRILLDCGMFQGKGSDTDAQNRHFGFHPKSIDMVIMSHAHIDHSGLLPRLVAEGYRGPIHATHATRDLCEIMLMDSAHIQESDVKYINKARAENNKPPIKPLYSKEDVNTTLSLFQGYDYDKRVQLADDVWVEFTDAGHILGSAVVSLRVKDGKKYHRIAFTGDIGRYSNRILRAPQAFPQCDYLIAESTYGDRLHNKPPRAKENLFDVVNRTCVQKGGKLIIPAFSVGRTQEIVSVLNDLEFEGKLPKIKVFVDSPLAVNATDIMKDHPECFNDRMLKFMKKDDDPFGFGNLKYIRKVEESKALNGLDGPAIIISASGMIEGGRIKHHLINNIHDKRNTVLIVGWCSKSSVGGQLINGADEVSLYGKMYKVKMQVEKANPFSAHGDYEEMVQLLSKQEKHIIKKTFLVHGTHEVMESYREHLYQQGFHNVYIPKYKETFEID